MNLYSLGFQHGYRARAPFLDDDAYKAGYAAGQLELTLDTQKHALLASQ